MKKLVITLLTLMMVISGACILPTDGNKALANGTDNGYRVEEVEVSSLSKNELPICKDTSQEWLFAGWYKDANCEVAYTSYPSGKTAYAKFVPENVLSVKLQLKEGTGTGGADEKTNLRLVSSVDCLDYRKVGFAIYYNGATTPIIASSSKVFKKIVASSESGVDYNYSPKVLDVESEYFVTATLINIAKTNFDKNFYIRPFWITRDGTTVYGVNRYVNVNNGLDETNINIPVKTEGELITPTVKVAGDIYDASVAYYDGTYTHLNINVADKDSAIKSVSEVTVNEGNITGKAVYRNLYTTHESGDVTKPNSDTTWYDENADELVIATSADLYGFASLVNSGTTFENETIYMVSDIIVNKGTTNHGELTWTADGMQYGWTQIGNDKAKRFAGIFDGQMHTISGICVDSSASRNGLFGVIDTNAVVKNFKLTNSYFKILGNSYVGSIVGQAYGGSIENIYSNAIIDNRNASGGGGFCTGGLVGNVAITEHNFSMNGCWFDGTVTNGDRFLGGLIGAIGEAQGSNYVQTITNCLNTGNLPGTSASSRWVGGLFGYNYGVKSEVSHCLNSGQIGRKVDTYKAQFSLIGNFSYASPNVTKTYATSQSAVTNYMNQTHADASTNVMSESSIAGKLSMTKVTKDLFTYVTEADTYTNESYWAIVPGKAPVLSAFADMVEGQCQAVDTSWFNKNDDTFNLKDAADLYGLSLLTRDAENTAGFENKTIVLDKDILVNEGITYNEGGVVENDTPNEWLAIGTETEPFKGNFDGNGNNISGLYLNATSIGNGLFGYTYKDVSIKNFSLTNSYFYSSASAYSDLGSIVGRTEGGEFDSIYSNAIVYGRCDRIGGLIGHVEGEDDFSINNCWFDGSAIIENSRANIGGLVGHIKNEQNNHYRKVTNCLNSGVIKAINSGTKYMGGLIGLNNNGGGLTISNCLNVKEIQYAATVNTSKLTDKSTYLYGLIAGQVNPATVINDVYTIPQEYLPNEGYGYAFKYEPQKAINTISGINAMEKMPALYTPVDVNGKSKVYWAVTDTTPVLADFIEFIDEDNAVIAIDTSWYNNSNSYTLYDVADLYGFAKLVNEGNDFAGKTIKLGADITIPNSGDATDWEANKPAFEWISIGTNETKFNGIFDGNGNNISGLYVNATKTGNGFFGYTGKDVIIKNFSLTNSYFYSSASAYADLGSVVGRTEGGTFDSIYSDAIVYGACNNIGGLIGHMEGTGNFSINNCWYNGHLTVANSCDNVGGLIGHVKNESGKYSRTVTNCLNSGVIKATNSGTKYMGGLIGLNNSGAGLTIEKCLNTKEIQYAGTVNTAKLTDKTTYLYGLIAGQVNTATIINDVYTITQEFLPTEGYGYAFKYEPQKGVDTICGVDAVVNMPNLFTSQTVDRKDYWVITDKTPILSSFIEYANVEQVGLYADASWYNKNDNEFTLNTAEELYGLAKLCNNRIDTFSGKIIKLGSDIQLNVGVATDWKNEENLPINLWQPIGITPGTAFAGTFNGQNHTISGLYMKSNGEYLGLFGILNQSGSATVQNLRLTNSYLECTETARTISVHGLGSIVGQGAGLIDTVYSDAIVVNGSTQTGGLVGSVISSFKLDVKNSWFTGIVEGTTKDSTAEYDWVGGILGYSTSSSTVNMTDCFVAAELRSNLVSEYTNDASETLNGVSYVGGLSGRLGMGTMQGCMVYGTLGCAKGNTGSMLGLVVSEEAGLQNCYNATEKTQNYYGGTNDDGTTIQMSEEDVKVLEDRGAGNYNLVFANQNSSDYSSYCDALTNKKFTKYAESSTGDEKGKVYNATFVRDEIVITVVFMEKAGEICISVEKDLPLSEHLLSKSAYSGAERTNAETTLHMLGFAEENYGDSFVIRLKNGHFIISDGGMMGEAETLYNYLLSLTPEGEVPVIEAWFISHGHTDHIGALSAFVHNEIYYKNVCVNGVYFNEPNPNGFAAQDYLSVVKRVSNLRTESNEITQIYRPKTGQRYYFDDITIDVLHTQEQLALAEYANKNGNEFNETSTWLMFTMDDYKFLHAGDAAQNSVNTVIGNYSENYLDFDVMATLHHAQNIYTNFIDTFDYDILLYTTKNKWSQNDSASDADNEAMLNKAQYAYAWGEGTVALTFSKNNGIKLPTGTWFID